MFGPRVLLFACWIAALLAIPIQSKPKSAEVRVGDVYVFTLYGGLGSANTEERSARISRNILILANNPMVSPDEIVVAEGEAGVSIDCRDVTILLVTPLDAKSERLSPIVLANRWAEAIQQSIRRYRTQTRHYLEPWQRAWRLLLATVGVLLVSRLLRGVRRHRSWQKRVAAGPRRISGFLMGLVAAALQVTFTLVYLATALGYLIYALSLFPQTVGTSYQLIFWVTTPLRLFNQAFWEYFPNLFVIVLILLMGRFFLSFLMVIFLELEEGTMTLGGFYRDWARPSYNLCKALVIVVVLIAIFPYIPGSNSRAFQGMSLLIGVLVSVSSSSYVGNLISGIILIYTRAFKVGDVVDIGSIRGVVLDRQLLATRVKTPQNIVVTIPNATVMNSAIHNHSEQAQAPGVGVSVQLTLGYDVPWRQVHELLCQAALTTPAIQDEPAPYVIQTALNDYHISYELTAFTAQPLLLYRLKGDLHQSIQDRFSEAGIEIMSPSYLAMRDGNPSTLPSLAKQDDGPDHQ